MQNQTKTEIHDFLVAFPPEHWKSASDATPLKVIKTLLSEIVTIKVGFSVIVLYFLGEKESSFSVETK